MFCCSASRLKLKLKLKLKDSDSDLLVKIVPSIYRALSICQSC